MISRAALVGVIILVLVLVLWLMRRGWRAKAASQSALPEPEQPSFSLGDEDRVMAHQWRMPPTEVRYLGSNLAGDWLQRVVVHDLGVPSRARIAIGATDVWLERQGARPILITSDNLRGARSDRAIAGRAYEAQGVAVLTWELGEVTLDSGFRVVDPDAQRVLIEAANSLLSSTATTSPGGAS